MSQRYRPVPHRAADLGKHITVVYPMTANATPCHVSCDHSVTISEPSAAGATLRASRHSDAASLRSRVHSYGTIVVTVVSVQDSGAGRPCDRLVGVGHADATVELLQVALDRSRGAVDLPGDRGQGAAFGE